MSSEFEFMQFDSIEDAFIYMAQQEDAANSTLAPEQQGIGWGDHWIRFSRNPNYMIYGRCFTEEEVHDMEAHLIEKDPDALPGELESMMTTLRDTHERGYRYGRAYSVIVPEGELGDTHIASVWPIDHSLFEAAEKVGWQTLELDDDAFAQIELAYEALRAHQQALVGENHPMFKEGAGGESDD